MIPALGRLIQEDCKFKAILGYIDRFCLKRKKKKKKEVGEDSQESTLRTASSTIGRMQFSKFGMF
jgi:hypothetical protein